MNAVVELEGASLWDDEVYRAFRSHMEEENDLLRAYRRLADDAASPDVAFLVNLIIDDEKRHHRVFEQLAVTMQHVVALEPGSGGIPDVPLRRPEAGRLRSATAELLAFEREDAKRLRQLRRTLRPVADTTIWSLLIETMELDTKKHIAILKHIAGIAEGILGAG